jgi:hypothetical protein
MSDVHDLDADRYRWGNRMPRVAPVTDWADPNDPTVQIALQLKCGACKQPAGAYCLNTVNGEPLINIGRYVHHFRLDKHYKTSGDDQ